MSYFLDTWALYLCLWFPSLIKYKNLHSTLHLFWVQNDNLSPFSILLKLFSVPRVTFFPVERKMLTLDSPLINLFCPVISKITNICFFPPVCWSKLRECENTVKACQDSFEKDRIVSVVLRMTCKNSDIRDLAFVLSLLLLPSVDYWYLNCADYCSIFK